MITEEELLKFFGEDEPYEIARYLSTNMNRLLDGTYTVEQFVELHKPEEDE